MEGGYSPLEGGAGAPAGPAGGSPAGEAAAAAGPGPGSVTIVEGFQDMVAGGDWMEELERDLKHTGVSRRYSAAERKRLAETQSIGYLPGNSRVYRKWRATAGASKVARWVLMGLIGAATGLVGYLLYASIDLLASGRVRALGHLLGARRVGLAWLVELVIGQALVGGAALVVVKVMPAAQGSGVPEIMAYLNGCLLHKILNLKTFLVKFVSCALAVGAGLPVGPEGPMIHLGAILGAGISQFQSSTLGIDFGFFKQFRGPKDKRDFITAGVAAGVATAFGAPIGGLLFAFEEVASFWQQKLGWQIFFACMCAIFSLNSFRSVEIGITEGHFGLFSHEHTVPFEVARVITSHVAAIVPALLIGVACGGAAILFRALYLRAMRLRARYVLTDRAKVLEPLAIIALYSTLGVIIASAFKCLEIVCEIDQQSERPECVPGAEGFKRVVDNSTYETWTCPVVEEHVGGGDLGVGYNEFASLFFETGEDTVRHLFSRGTHRQFGYGALFCMLVLYFLGSVVASGTYVSAGLFVPMLVNGALIGRIIGVMAVDLVGAGGHSSPTAPPGVFYPPSAWEWLDPGIFALIGAGAFMGGVTRLTISLAVIVMEMSNEVRFMLPILLAIMVAKWTGDLAGGSLYHSILEEKCIPFLPHEPKDQAKLELFSVRQIMRRKVVCLNETEALETVKRVLRETEHEGFPVTEAQDARALYKGLISREHLKVLLEKSHSSEDLGLSVTYEDLNDKSIARQSRWLDADGGRGLLTPLGGANGHGGAGPADATVDLSPFMDTSAFFVQESCSAERAYTLFCAMGLRHMPVVDSRNGVVGMLTRKDLLVGGGARRRRGEGGAGGRARGGGGRRGAQRLTGAGTQGYKLEDAVNDVLDDRVA